MTTELSTLLGKATLTYNQSPHKWDELLGIELELENVINPNRDDWTIPGWTLHQDQSLRNGLEFVTYPAQGGEALENAINEFYNRKFVYENGPRTSTHIHINMRDATDETLASMVMIVYMIEDAIYQSVEESRKWGGYSVSLTEMPHTRLRSLVSPVSLSALTTAIAPSRNADRYYGLNTNMNRHGTVEFRYFPGGPTREELISWVDLVVAIKKTAKKYNKEELINLLISPSAVVSFLNAEFGEWGNRLLDAVGPDRMFNSFAEIATMAGDDDTRELASSVMWITEPLLGFLAKTTFKGSEEPMNYLRNLVKNTNVLSKGDWNYYINQARNMQEDLDPLPTWEEEEEDRAIQENDEYVRLSTTRSPFTVPAPDFSATMELMQAQLRAATRNQ